MCLKVDGINGESVKGGHEEEIDVLTWEWGVTQASSMHVGGGGGSGKAIVEDLIITKYSVKSGGSHDFGRATERVFLNFAKVTFIQSVIINCDP